MFVLCAMCYVLICIAHGQTQCHRGPAGSAAASASALAGQSNPPRLTPHLRGYPGLSTFELLAALRFLFGKAAPIPQPPATPPAPISCGLFGALRLTKRTSCWLVVHMHLVLRNSTRDQSAAPRCRGGHSYTNDWWEWEVPLLGVCACNRIGMPP